MFFIEKVILYEAHYINIAAWSFCCKKVTFCYFLFYYWMWKFIFILLRCDKTWQLDPQRSRSHWMYTIWKHKIRISLNRHELRCDVWTQTHCLSLIDIPYWSSTGSRVIYLWCIETPKIPQPIKEIEITIAVPCSHVILALPGMASGHMLAISE